MPHLREEVSPPRIDITACLDAVRLYDADYHRDRDTHTVVQEEPEAVFPEVVSPEVVPLKIVSLWEYLLATGMKKGGGLLGAGLFLTMLIAGVLIMFNGVLSVYDYQRAQPILHSGQNSGKPITTTIKIFRRGANGPDMEADASDTWLEPSPYPLPPHWAEINTDIYVSLLLIMLLSRYGSILCLQRARRINTGLPIHYADTAHLPAQESLVRASQEPAQENLVRASSLPPTPPNILLRSVGLGQETPLEQLVRATTGPE